MTWDDNSVPTVSMSNLDSEKNETALDTQQTQGEPQSRVISRVLTPALRLWIRSQVDHIEDLELTIEASDRQLLHGNINRLTASAHKAIYQGLHFSHLQVAGQQIQTNLRQLLRGKPFRLLAAFPIAGEIHLSEADLNASLNAPLLANAIKDFLEPFLQESELPASSKLQEMQVRLGTNDLTLSAIVTTGTHKQTIACRTGLRIKKGNLLVLEGFQHCSTVDQLVPIQDCPTTLTISLGSDIHLEQLTIQAQHLICRGQILVRP